MRRPLCLLLFVLLIVMAGCAARNQVPLPLQAHADILGFTNIRHYGDTPPDDIDKMLTNWTQQAQLLDSAEGVNFLSLSGGGANGAFGAGFLSGWTANGDRPTFHYVTGVSTGALIAPFAFLGPKYDTTLKHLFTTFHTEDLVVPSTMGAGIFNDGYYDTTPFRKALNTYITPEVIKEIAKAHRQGRRLIIGTTNLDAMRPVYWNIGAIAQYNTKAAAQLIHDIILASASVPVAFPPVYITVRAHGKAYDEMHVDGGVSNQVFTYPAGIHIQEMLGKVGIKQKINLYVIRNNTLHSQGKRIEPNVLDIAERSMDGLIRNQSIGDLYRIYYTAKRDGLDFHLAYIPPTWDEPFTELFDPAYMSKLFKLGRNMAIGPSPWQKTPPENLGPAAK